MTVYVVTIEDRHSDLEVKVFERVEDATEHAMGVANYGASQNDMEVEISIVEGFPTQYIYSCEGDNVTVHSCEVG